MSDRELELKLNNVCHMYWKVGKEDMDGSCLNPDFDTALTEAHKAEEELYSELEQDKADAERWRKFKRLVNKHVTVKTFGCAIQGLYDFGDLNPPQLGSLRSLDEAIDDIKE